MFWEYIFVFLVLPLYQPSACLHEPNDHLLNFTLREPHSLIQNTYLAQCKADHELSMSPPVKHSIRNPDLNNPTALQQHVLFWDPNHDNIITPNDVYTGFRSLGFSVIFSLGSLLIPLFFSYPTRLAHSYLPDPYFRIYIDSIHKAKHGSDTGIYDSDGHLRAPLFDEMFAKFDGSGTGSLNVSELFALMKKNRVAADPAGWSFAFMEWWTTWLLLQQDGRVWKDDLRQCYDGSLFWRIKEKQVSNGDWQQGYGWREFFRSIRTAGTWKEWELH